jgi:hypothetical protein
MRKHSDTECIIHAKKLSPRIHSHAITIATVTLKRGWQGSSQSQQLGADTDIEAEYDLEWRRVGTEMIPARPRVRKFARDGNNGYQFRE